MRNSACFDWDDKEYISHRIQKSEQENEQDILKYLKSVTSHAATASAIRDVFNIDTRITTNSYTDGVWEWNDALIYYIENYHYRISDEFLQHMKNNNWHPPY